MKDEGNDKGNVLANEQVKVTMTHRRGANGAEREERVEFEERVG